MLSIQGPKNVPVIILKVVTPRIHRMIERARPKPFGDQVVHVADAESQLLFERIAFRPLDQGYLRAILIANSGQFDLEWVREEAIAAGREFDRLNSFGRLVPEFYQS